ncbi:START-like domain [Phytophthora cinnamomi]|uniref:START-like domain n=1 Tax=Phytophthora cinnamomi TaxID=4785 RepID=UPI003559F128|nr:START-like domain [Phytophthora cinnamomi]
MPPTPSPSSRAAQSCVIDDDHDSMPAMRFPLPSGYFGDVQVSASKRREYSDIVRRRVNTMLADEHRHSERRAQQQPVVQETEWKFFRRMGGLKVYQRRLRGRSKQEVAAEEDFPEAAVAVERGNPSMLTDGAVAGTIEDMLYGMSATTQEEMMTGLSFTAPPQDAVLLSVVERSTVEDPLRSAELLWVLTKLPILNPRDVCYLKATGVGCDGKGRPYGYMVLHSVELPECPPFDYRKTKILRSKLYFSFLFREITPGYVGVMGRGIFDLAGGELLKLVLPHATTSVIDGLLRGVSCGEAKKLTLLALRNHDGRRQVKAISKQSVCSACIRGKKGVLSGVRLRVCDVCGVPICKNCKVKDKRMFMGTRQPCRKVACCPTCAQQANCITGVRLGEPEFVVVAEFYSKNRPTSSSSSSGHSAAAATLSTPSVLTSARHIEQTEMVSRNNETWRSEPTSLLSDASKACSSVDVTNSTVDDSCAGFDFDVSYSGPSSDLNSGPYRRSSNAYARDDDDLEEEPEPVSSVSADLLKEYAELNAPSHAHGLSSRGLTAWDGSYRGHPDDFAKPAATKPRPNNMLEWLIELQSSAEEAYITAKANEEIMKRSMR